MSESEVPDLEGQDETLVETLQLERIEENLFRGTTPDASPGRIFGGQVIAQSLLAAYETVPDRVCHSLHCYFIRPGDPTVPIVFEVDRSRDGGSFTTRRVIAVQHGKQIFNLAASFMTAEDGFEHQADMPKARHWMMRERPIEMRSPDARTYWMTGAKEPESNNWIRCRTPIGTDAYMHQV